MATGGGFLRLGWKIGDFFHVRARSPGDGPRIREVKEPTHCAQTHIDIFNIENGSRKQV